MENGKKYNVIVIALILILGLLIYQNVRLNREIEYLNNRVSNMESNINLELNNLIYGISDRVESILSEQQNIVSSFSSTYNGVDTKSGTVKTLIEFTLKQSDADSKVYLNVSSQNNSNGLNYECISANGLNYSCEIELSYKENYTLNIYQKSADGDYKKLNSYPYQKDIKSDFENRISFLESGTGTDKEKTTYTFKLRNKTFGEQDFKIKSVIVKAYYKDKEVFSKDVTAYNILNSEAVDKLNIMIAAGDINASALPEVKYGEISTDDKGDEYGSYMVNILHSETGAPVEHNNYPEYSFKVIVTLFNGEVYEL
ncbi:MAG TPA: hypothetical protein GXX20_05195 [Clostridiaceae bacterium]|nr:hypothetical protein [Clostridiaceae bacterium]